MVRTALALISFGFAISTFFSYLREQQGQSATVLSPRAVGLTMIVIALIGLIAATWRQQRAVKLITPTGCFPPCALDLAATWRNPPPEEEIMSVSCSGSLVFFGAAGDLAHKKIFQVLPAMVRPVRQRDHPAILNVIMPVFVSVTFRCDERNSKCSCLTNFFRSLSAFT